MSHDNKDGYLHFRVEGFNCRIPLQDSTIGFHYGEGSIMGRVLLWGGFQVLLQGSIRVAFPISKNHIKKKPDCGSEETPPSRTLNFLTERAPCIMALISTSFNGCLCTVEN